MPFASTMTCLPSLAFMATPSEAVEAALVVVATVVVGAVVVGAAVVVDAGAALDAPAVVELFESDEHAASPSPATTIANHTTRRRFTTHLPARLGEIRTPGVSGLLRPRARRRP